LNKSNFESQDRDLVEVSKDQQASVPSTLPSGLQVWEGSSAIVEQGRHWSSSIIWLIVFLFGGSLIWAFTAKIDQTVTVRGRLEPKGSVQNIDSPSSGVVKKVFVKEGDLVTSGQPLLDIEAKGLSSRRKAIEQTLRILDLQAVSLDTIIRSGGNVQKMLPLPSIPVVNDKDLFSKLFIARNQTLQIKAQLKQLDYRLDSKLDSLQLKERIAIDMKSLYYSGATARNSYLIQLNEVQELKSELASLKEEKVRIIGSATVQLNEINRQIINLRSELIGLKETISYRTIYAPTAGRIFDNRIRESSVINASQILLKIVPNNNLQGKVDILNSDIGFVKVGQKVSVSVDSFPSGEFGYIKGTLTKLGSDALQPDQLNQQFRFPGTVTLDQQSVQSGNQMLNLQSGMGITANIKLRTRPAITIVSDLFTNQMDGLKRFR